MERVILHSDLNNFYASVECLYDPALRSKPVAVSGNPEARHGIVLAKNYAAKACGVCTGNPLWLAKQKCPDIVFVPPHYDLYMQYSHLARQIYNDYTDQVEPFGLDECWLDVTGSTGLFGSGKAIADKLRHRIKNELGVTASVGVSYNKIFAKLGSDLRKPDATTVILQDQFQQMIWPLPVSELLYVGRATLSKLKRYGIRTIGELASTDRKFLRMLLGQNGETLWTFANGLDTSVVSNINTKSIVKSIGNSTTTPRDLISPEDIKITLYVLCESVSARMREYGFVCRTVRLSIRDSGLKTYERQGPLIYPNRTAESLFEKAYELFMRNHNGKPVRSLGVRACNLELRSSEQLSFLPDIARLQKLEQLEETIDDIRNRFGHFAVKRGIMLSDTALSGLNPKEDHIIHPESFFH